LTPEGKERAERWISVGSLVFAIALVSVTCARWGTLAGIGAGLCFMLGVLAAQRV
jgi:hypothetical protein